ncbi:galactose-1-phosphate uridylyltransferase [Sporomusa sp.]|uniref:galactose-1-phosphate uridylyltransferase n=1 Tax=Sporomusa sp. TaxID=2078658 RepID=UPI002B9CFA24|nr:galactose-1-phosphate uridylyltransferase [Sporomusa sp.]HWR08634.1 galactose-1-phosphate uridylyltransferase [Sporomusa sp.]
MAELRWNPLLSTWTMVASNRQARPHLPQGWCPFCPGSGKVPDHYEVHKYDNDFPALSLSPVDPELSGSGPYKAVENYGKCEVILYSPEHAATLPGLSVDHIEKLINLLAERYVELAKDPKIKYIFQFENRGEEVGVTMPHPHGQIYAYPFVPQKIQVELDSCQDYYQSKEHCLICAMNREEIDFKQRIIAENNTFLAYLPFFTDYPYGVFIVSKQHRGNITQLSSQERRDLAALLKNVTGAFDTLFNKPFPYMMCIHQTPVNSAEYADAAGYYHFHIEFYPPLREENKIKFYASSEMGAWAACNPMAVEQTAETLRKAYARFVRTKGELHDECGHS